MNCNWIHAEPPRTAQKWLLWVSTSPSLEIKLYTAPANFSLLFAREALQDSFRLLITLYTCSTPWLIFSRYFHLFLCAGRLRLLLFSSSISTGIFLSYLSNFRARGTQTWSTDASSTIQETPIGSDHSERLVFILDFIISCFKRTKLCPCWWKLFGRQKSEWNIIYR